MRSISHGKSHGMSSKDMLVPPTLREEYVLVVPARDQNLGNWQVDELVALAFIVDVVA